MVSMLESNIDQLGCCVFVPSSSMLYALCFFKLSFFVNRNFSIILPMLNISEKEKAQHNKSNMDSATEPSSGKIDY